MAVSRSSLCLSARIGRVMLKAFIAAAGLLTCLIDSVSATLPCKETKELFKDIQKKLDTPLPINYLPAFLVIIFAVLVFFVFKTAYDVMEHRNRMNYVNQWDREHLGDDGIKNEVYIPYPAVHRATHASGFNRSVAV